MHPDSLVRRIHVCVCAAVPPVVWGGPGTGKTARITSYTRAIEAHGERWLLSRCEPIDLAPRVYHEGRVIVSLPPEVERCAVAPLGRFGIRAVIFADELNRATQETEGAFLSIADSAPAGVAVISACNPPTRGQAARSFGSAMSNRFCHLDVEVDADAYATAMLQGWPSGSDDLPVPDATAIGAETLTARAIVGGFIRAEGNDALSHEPSNPVEAGKAWPSPRSWDHAVRVYAVARSFDYPADDVMALVAGCVGPGLAVKFLAYAADASIDPEALLADPKGWDIPKGRVDKTIAHLSMVLAAVTRKLDDTRWRASWALVNVTCDAGQADAALFMANALMALLVANGKSKEPVKLANPAPMMPQRIVALMTAAARKVKP